MEVAPKRVATCLQPGQFLGDYELLQELARGGMGVVYRARQASLNREVAVKLLPGGRLADARYVERFQREAQAAASLNHPNIVAIHEVGEQDGQFYFSMELIQGRSLADLARDHPLPEREAARIIRTVAGAVAFAHSRQLLHRDLKPSNVLLDEQGEPHVTDFGLAKRADDAGDLTLTGQILGTPNYMAPEQADPNIGATSEASDVYSLGAMLYDLLTDRPPFVAETVPQTLRLVIEGTPVPPRLLQPGLSKDLETICLKCLERAPNVRYQSAREVAEELGRFLRHESIQARPVGILAKTARWAKRKPTLASALASLALLLLILCIGSPLAIFRIQEEREHSEAARRREAALRVNAEAGARAVKRQLYRALLQQAEATLRSGEIGQRVAALAAIRDAAEISNSVELRREALTALSLPDLSLDREVSIEPGVTLQLLDPGFTRVALCRGAAGVEIRALSDWRVLTSLPASKNLPAYVGWWGADGKYLAVKRDLAPGGARADVEIWDVSNSRLIFVLHDVASQCISFGSTETQLTAALVGGAITTWDLMKVKEVSRQQLSETPICIEVAPDGSRLAVLSESAGKSKVAIYEAKTGTELLSQLRDDSVMRLAWHPGGGRLALVDEQGMVHLMDAHTGETHLLGSHKAQAVTVTFSPQGDYLFTGGWEGEVISWDMSTQQRALTIPRKSWITQFRSDGQQCALHTASGIQLYSFVRPNCRSFEQDLGPRLRHAAFSPDGRWLAASADGSVGTWDLPSKGPAALIPAEDETRPSFTSDSRKLLITGLPAQYAHWRLRPATNTTSPPGLEAIEQRGGPGNDPTQTVETTSPDGRWLTTYRRFSPLLQVNRLAEREHITTICSQANISEVSFNPDGKQMSISSRLGVEFWSTETWTRTRVLTNFTGIIFPPQSSNYWLTSGFRDAGLHDAVTLEALLPLPTGTLPLALSADGQQLAVSVDAKHLKVWNLARVRLQLQDLGLDWQR